MRWLDSAVPRRGYHGSCGGQFPPEELRPATDGNHLCEACETMMLRLVKSVQDIAAAEVAGFGRMPSGDEREDLLEDCRQYLAYNGWDLVPTIHPDTPSATVYILTRNDPNSGPELPNPLMFDSVGRVLAFVQGLNYGASTAPRHRRANPPRVRQCAGPRQPTGRLAPDFEFALVGQKRTGA